MTGMTVSSMNVATAAGVASQTPARLNRMVGASAPQIAGTGKDALTLKRQAQPDMLANLKAIEAQIAARAQQAANVNALDISYNKQQALLSVKVEKQQTGELIRELKFKDYQAMAYSPHGYKGAMVDITA